MHTGDGVDEVEGVGDAREVGERPAEGVPGVGAEVDGDEQVPAAAALPGLALELRRGVGHHRDEARQHHLPPAVLLHVLLHRLHRLRSVVGTTTADDETKRRPLTRSLASTYPLFRLLLPHSLRTYVAPLAAEVVAAKR